MAMKNTAEVLIAGRVYKISGYESPEYLHQIALYLNDKMSDLQKAEGYRKQNADQKQLLLNMNLADDFFKSRRQAEKLTADLEKKERELYSVRHDLVEAQLALEQQKRELDEFKEKEKAERRELETLKKKWKDLEEQKAEKLKAQGGKTDVPEERPAADAPALSGSPESSAEQTLDQNPGQNQPRQNHSRGRKRH